MTGFYSKLHVFNTISLFSNKEGIFEEENEAEVEGKKNRRSLRI